MGERGVVKTEYFSSPTQKTYNLEGVEINVKGNGLIFRVSIEKGILKLKCTPEILPPPQNPPILIFNGGGSNQNKFRIPPKDFFKDYFRFIIIIFF